MPNELNKADYFFKIKDGLLILQGAQSEGSPLWNIAEREDKAKQHVLQSVAILDQHTHLFVGIEHLPYLIANHTAFKSDVYVIEKSKILYEFYLAAHQLQHNIPANIKIILGDFGFYPKNMEPDYATIISNNEIIAITLQLFQAPIQDWLAVKVLSLNACQEDAVFYTLFFQAVLLIIAAKLFHEKNKPIYETIRNTPKQKIVLQLYNNCPIIINYQKLFYPKHIFRDYQRVLLELDHYQLDPSRNPIFSHIKDMPNPDMDTTFHAVTQNALRLLAKIQELAPEYICLLNRMPFNTLEDMLFCEQMIREFNIFYISYYADSLTHTGAITNGLWTTSFIDPYFSHPNYFILNANTQIAITYPQQHNPFRSYPMYIELNHTQFLPPIATAEQTNLDICIMQNAAPQFYNFYLVSDLFKIIMAHGNKKNLATSFYNFFYQLSAMIKVKHPYYYHHFEIVIKDLDFACYELFKSQVLIDHLSSIGKYRFKFYGKGWDQLIEPQYYGGYLKSTNEICETFNRTKLTIISNLTVNYEIPHHTMLKAYASGCLPVISTTAYNNNLGSYFDFINEQDIIRFANTEELNHHIDYYLSHWDDRQDNIKRVQNTWLKQLSQFENYPSIDQILAKKTPHFDYSHLDYSISGAEALDQDLCQIGIAYLHHYLGLNKIALDALHTVLMKQTIISKEVLIFTKHLAKQLNERNIFDDLVKLEQ